jgi:hypothetical protein
MERKKIVKKRSPRPKKRTSIWRHARKIIPFILLFLLLLLSMMAAGYMIFLHAAPSQVTTTGS